MIDTILKNLISSVNGAHAVMLMDGDGSSVSKAGSLNSDMRLLGAWKEIHLDRIRDISERLGLGTVQAVLFLLEEGNELVVPVAGEYCLLLFLSAYAGLQEAITELTRTVELLKSAIEQQA